MKREIETQKSVVFKLLSSAIETEVQLLSNPETPSPQPKKLKSLEKILPKKTPKSKGKLITSSFFKNIQSTTAEKSSDEEEYNGPPPPKRKFVRLSEEFVKPEIIR